MGLDAALLLGLVGGTDFFGAYVVLHHQAGHHVGDLGAFGNPAVQKLFVQAEGGFGTTGQRVVVAQFFNEFFVAATAAVGGDDVVLGQMDAATAKKADFNGHFDVLSVGSRYPSGRFPSSEGSGDWAAARLRLSGYAGSPAFRPPRGHGRTGYVHDGGLMAGFFVLCKGVDGGNVSTHLGWMRLSYRTFWGILDSLSRQQGDTAHVPVELGLPTNTMEIMPPDGKSFVMKRDGTPVHEEQPRVTSPYDDFDGQMGF